MGDRIVNSQFTGLEFDSSESVYLSSLKYLLTLKKKKKQIMFRTAKWLSKLNKLINYYLGELWNEKYGPLIIFLLILFFS